MTVSMPHPQTPNPLLEDWTTPYGLPPFERIAPEHFLPAFASAFAEHDAEIDAIAQNPAPATFENTMAALERSGRRLRRISALFFNLAHSHTNDAIEAVEREVAPLFARHDAAIHLNDALFARIDALYRQRDALALTAEQRRVLERHHLEFRRAGAGLAPKVKARLAEIGERLAALGTQFSQNVLADEKCFTLVLDEGDDLAGLPDWLSARRRRRRASAAFPAIMSSRSIAPASSLFSRSPRGGICAKKPGAPGSRAANRAARATIARLPPKC